MKILYISCFHQVLEYDNCITFDELGFDWFSTGVYLDPRSPVNKPGIPAIRPGINKQGNNSLKNLFLKDNPSFYEEFSGLNRPQVKITKELANNFDCVFCTNYKFIINNWDSIKHLPIVWRTSGSIKEAMEKEMKPHVDNGNVFPVRFSEIELKSPDSNGGDVIRNFVDEDLYTGWVGDIKEVLSFQSWFSQRMVLDINKVYASEIAPNFNTALYGAQVGANHPLVRGTLSWDQQKEAYQRYMLYFYIGSPVGVVAYNYMEAMMTGMPIITYGPKIGGWTLESTGDRFHEPSEFIDNEVDGFYSDDINQLKSYISNLLKDSKLSVKMSNNARKKALNLFSKQSSVSKWKDFFKKIK